LLFNSPAFLFAFLPVVLAAYFLVARFIGKAGALWCALIASYVFYGWGDPGRLLILVGSTLANFAVGSFLLRHPRRDVLAIGILANVALLGYFKYWDFLFSNLGWSAPITPEPVGSAIPVGISFYTITQIIFLVDCFRHQSRQYRPAEYALLVSYFLHLAAGPILDHKQIIPQFRNEAFAEFASQRLARGLAWFAAGLFKKVILADGAGHYADSFFASAKSESVPAFADAWVGTASFALQIYFDFSGYSDMAIGLALIMGVAFPLNFNSPYKSASIIDFWRRWHMTLSAFLRDYVYIPLGGNREGGVRRNLNIMSTMLLGGIWHGASWNFVLWGALHGLGLVCNRLWRDHAAVRGISMPNGAGWFLTMAFVLFAWVPFRAVDLQSTFTIWQAMLGLGDANVFASAETLAPAAWVLLLGTIVFAAPNTQQIFGEVSPGGMASRIRWKPDAKWALAMGAIFGIAAARTFGVPSEFLYFRF
jgi:alginate O-acetyltransferase complex protein AlgI